MRYAVLFLLITTPALADGICIDASDRNQYDARPLSLHEVLARNALGKEHRAARLGTTCIHIDRTSGVALHSMTRCIGLGDDVGISTMGGRSETCRVTSVKPADESYADAKYKAE
jgi:hypothetical protein